MENDTISKDERELYDRQIRLWGLDGQSRLRNARVLILGLDAGAVEATKNLVLAGIGSVCLQSNKEVTEKTLSYNFFVDSSHLQQNEAEASKLAVQRLNPKVALTVETTELSKLEDSFFKDFDVVILSQCYNKQEIIKVNSLVRSNAAFYYVLMHGWMGFLFVDLGEKPHKFQISKEFINDTPKIGKLSESQSLIGITEPTPNSGSNEMKLQFEEQYTSFADAIDVSNKFAEGMKLRLRSRVSPYLTGALAMLNGTTIMDQHMKLGLPRGNITPQFLSEFENGRDIQVKGVAAVVGGFLSQDIINYLTQREYTIQNTLVYDALRGKGLVYYLNK